MARLFPGGGVGAIITFVLLLFAGCGAVTGAVIVVLTTGRRYVVAGSLSMAS